MQSECYNSVLLQEVRVVKGLRAEWELYFCKVPSITPYVLLHAGKTLLQSA